MNLRNEEGRTALQLAIICNIHSELVELLMSVESMDVNARDKDGMTALDILRQRPRSESSERIARKLVSAGGMFSGCHRDSEAARRVVASHIRMQSMAGGSPGTCFRIPDPEILALSSSSSFTTTTKVPTCVVSEGTTQRLKRLFFKWSKIKKRDARKLGVNMKSRGGTEIPIPLRQRFSKRTACSNKEQGGRHHGLATSNNHTRTWSSSSSSVINQLLCFGGAPMEPSLAPASGLMHPHFELYERSVLSAA